MMNDKLRAAAQAAYKAMIAAELSDGSRREWEAAVDGLKDALAEPAIKDSLTVAEPVAWTTMPEAEDWCFVASSKDPTGKLEGKWFPLYTAPPRREWIGLTDVDFEKEKFVAYNFMSGASFAEAKLREKNGG
jgi:hypothetical protein